MTKWILKRIGANYEQLSRDLNIDPVAVAVMRNRGLQTVEEMRTFLNPSIHDLYDGEQMADMTKTVDLLYSALGENKKIRIIGDYDIDGICATAILLKGLRAAGFQADYVIPHRVIDGYGLNEKLIQDAYEQGIDLVLTCDNGISAKTSVELLKELGMQIIITDHHEVPLSEEGDEVYPPADAIVNPKRREDPSEFKGICGAYVAYRLLRCFYRAHEECFREVMNWSELLELAAFATIGDVMELKGENRTLVSLGLKEMENSNNLGLRTLISLTKKKEGRITGYQVGFVYGPCINATGRLDTAERALKLLLTESEQEALLLAEELRLLNEERKILTQKGVIDGTEQAKQQIAAGNKVLVLYLKDCHESIAGIIAGRIREAFSRPTLVVTDAQSELKGSGRSIEKYPMYEKLSECSELFTKFGGHPMAAGFSLPKENLKCLTENLNRKCGLEEDDLASVIAIDVELRFSYVSEKLIQDLNRLEPFGNGNPKPVFAQRQVTFMKETIFGKSKSVAAYKVRDRYGNFFELKYFGDLNRFHEYLDEVYKEGAAEQLKTGADFELSVIYYPDLNTYGGRREIQFIMQEYSK